MLKGAEMTQHSHDGGGPDGQPGGLQDDSRWQRHQDSSFGQSGGYVGSQANGEGAYQAPGSQGAQQPGNPYSTYGQGYTGSQGHCVDNPVPQGGYGHQGRPHGFGGGAGQANGPHGYEQAGQPHDDPNHHPRFPERDKAFSDEFSQWRQQNSEHRLQASGGQGPGQSSIGSGSGGTTGTNDRDGSNLSSGDSGGPLGTTPPSGPDRGNAASGANPGSSSSGTAGRSPSTPDKSGKST
jgi:hypothetical protein